MARIDAYDIIVSPVITEKSTVVSENNQVVFNVRREATKPAIKQAIEQLFNVKVKCGQHAGAQRQAQGVSRRTRTPK